MYPLFLVIIIIFLIYCLKVLIKYQLKQNRTLSKFNSNILNSPPEKNYTPETVITCILMECNGYDDDDPAEQTIDELSVAGITFHDYADSDDGIIFGYAKREPNNIHDKNAIAIYSWNGLKVGYIPRHQQTDFNIFTSQECIPITCLLSNFVSDDGILKPSGSLTLYRGTKEALSNILTHFFTITEKIQLI